MLAALAHAPLSDQALCAAGRWFAAPHFRPITDVIAAAMQQLLGEGAIAARGDGTLRITPSGRRHLRSFCSGADPVGHAHDAALLLALDGLPKEARVRPLQTLIGRRQHELRQWQDAARACPCRWPAVRLLMRRRTAMIEADLAVLQRFARSALTGAGDP